MKLIIFRSMWTVSSGDEPKLFSSEALITVDIRSIISYSSEDPISITGRMAKSICLALSDLTEKRDELSNRP